MDLTFFETNLVLARSVRLKNRYKENHVIRRVDLSVLLLAFHINVSLNHVFKLNLMTDLSGHLLIAIPDLGDPNFSKTVVLLFQHSQEGASGLILNRPSDSPVSAVWEKVAGERCDCQDWVLVGGPVQGPLIALHSSIALSETQVLPAGDESSLPVYISLERENLDALVRQEKQPFKIFCGYAGWGPGQLESEVEQGGWLTLKANSEHVFNSPDGLWRQVCDDVGKDVLMPLLGRQNLGDPSLN